MDIEQGVMLDPMELFFIDEFLDHSQPQTEQLLSRSWRSGPLHKEGKLVLKISDIDGIVTRIFGFKRYCECRVTIQSMTQSVRLCGTASLLDEELIFDIFEYYGAMKIIIVVKSKGLFSMSTVGECILNLHDIVLAQEKHDATRSLQGVALHRIHDTPTVACREEYWGCSKYVPLVPSPSRGAATPMGIHLHARYVPLQHCLSCSIRSGRLCGSELHLAARYGSAKLMTELVQLLARKSLLRAALSLREDGGRANPLDTALATGNVRVAKVLLQRAGNLCFLNTLYEPSEAPRGPPPLRSRDFIPHGSCVDRSYFSQHQRGTVPAGDEGGAAEACSYGGAVHAAVHGGVGSLTLLLRFLRRHSSVVTGWERVQSFEDMVNWRGNRLDSFTPLMLACQLGDVACVRALLQLTVPSSSQACVKVDCVSSLDGSTALMLACRAGSVDIVNLLLARRRDVMEELPIAADGRTCRNASGSRSVVRLHFKEKSPVSLLECLPLARDTEGRQCVAIAAMHGHAEVVETLIAHGVPYVNTDLDGRTPLHWAALNGHLHVCEAIVRTEARLWEHFPPLNVAPTLDTVGSSFEFTSPEDKERRSKAGKPTKLVPTSAQSVMEGLTSHHAQNKKALSRSCVYSAGKSKRDGVTALIASLSHMTRRPSAILAMDIRGSRPADLAAESGHDAIVRLLVTAVKEVYRGTHPPVRLLAVRSSLMCSSSEQPGKVLLSAPSVLYPSGTGKTVSSSNTRTDALDEEQFAEDAAYTFATTLYFPTPPPSPSGGGDDDEKSCTDREGDFRI